MPKADKTEATKEKTNQDSTPKPPPLPNVPEHPAARSPAEGDPLSLLLFEKAHRLHFRERSPRAALAAWEAYMRAAPQGVLRIEAMYNRAIALVRPQALRPFAEGQFGGYRQEEAGALIDWLA